jgi:hypothetical protein
MLYSKENDHSNQHVKKSAKERQSEKFSLIITKETKSKNIAFSSWQPIENPEGSLMIKKSKPLLKNDSDSDVEFIGATCPKPVLTTSVTPLPKQSEEAKLCPKFDLKKIENYTDSVFFIELIRINNEESYDKMVCLNFSRIEQKEFMSALMQHGYVLSKMHFLSI